MGHDSELRRRRCECGAEGCTAEVLMSWEEQDAVDHAAPDLWIVAPDHELRGASRSHVVEQTERFVVVRAVEVHEEESGERS